MKEKLEIGTNKNKKMPGVFIGDPCYILPNDFYAKFWGEEHNYENGAFSKEGKPVMIVQGTAYGDGCYDGIVTEYPDDKGSAYSDGRMFAVDSGCLSVVNLEFADSDKIREVKDNQSLGIIIERPCVEMRLEEQGGTFDFNVLTDSDSGERKSICRAHIETDAYEEEEEYEEEDYDDEEYDEEEYQF